MRLRVGRWIESGALFFLPLPSRGGARFARDASGGDRAGRVSRGAPRRSRRAPEMRLPAPGGPSSPRGSLARSVPATSGVIAPPGRGGGFTTPPCNPLRRSRTAAQPSALAAPPSPAGQPVTRGGAKESRANRSVARPSARRSDAGLMKYPSDPPPQRALLRLQERGRAPVSGIFHYPAPADSCVTHRSRTTLPGTSTTFFAVLAGRAFPEAPLRPRQRGASPLRRSRCREAASPRRHLLVDHTPGTVAAQSGQAPAAVMRFSRIV